MTLHDGAEIKSEKPDLT